jgi:uncharacterized membrane protein YkvA (DUF1232 family)
MASRNDYSDEAFFQKITKYAKVAGKSLIEKALWLYYAMQRPDCPLWAKSAIIGALAYFIFPFDAIPDMVPGVGYTDDLGAIMTAIGMVSLYIDEEVKKKAAKKLSNWFD